MRCPDKGSAPVRRRRRASKSVVAAAVCGLLSASLAACGSDRARSDSAPGPVVIGVSAAQTGYLSSVDLGYIAGLRLAVQEINAAGGAGGRRLEISGVSDEQSNPVVGVQNVNKLVNADSVDAILAGGDSTACSAARPVVTRNQLPMVCVAPPPTGSAYQFEVSSSVGKMVETIMAYVKHLEVKSVAFLATTSVYGQLIGTLVKAAVQADGISISSTTTVSATATDMTATMQQVAASHPGAVVDSIVGPGHILEAKGAEAAGLDVPVIQMSDTLQTFEQAAAAYPRTEFVVQAPQAYPLIPDTALRQADQTFLTAYQASHGDSALVTSAAYGWDAVHILAEAVARSGSATGPKVQAELNSLSWQGAVSSYRYSTKDHTGQNATANPNSIGSYSGDKLHITFQG
ncbi:ABC transporter substrate-binding protein [Nocardia alni]|uniref:ABC transporter substrate-binding protein n=1 Tax=Nocardia alni TaxID=2815723 RepID=UPI001C236172|nr:ABC transporter substrate-binding protein [Nocardia alni]